MTRRQFIESALGTLPLPSAVSQLGDCLAPPGQVIASGVLESAEPIDGNYYHVNECVLMVKPTGLPADVLRQLQGRGVEVVVREVPLRGELQKIKR